MIVHRRANLGGVVHEVALTSLDSLLFDGAEATKGDLVAYLDAVADRLARRSCATGRSR